MRGEYEWKQESLENLKKKKINRKISKLRKNKKIKKWECNVLVSFLLWLSCLAELIKSLKATIKIKSKVFCINNSNKPYFFIDVGKK